MLFDPQVHFWIVIGCGVRLLLPSKGKNHAGILFPHRRQSVGAISAGDFDARPLSPQIDSGCSLDHLVNVSAADARSTFEKIEMTVGVGMDELRMRDAADQSQGSDQVAVDRSPC